MAADDQDALRVAHREAEPARERPRREAIDRDGRYDHDEGLLDERFAGRTQPEREDGRHRCGDDAARREPGEEEALAPGESRADRAQPHRDRPHAQQEPADERRTTPAEVLEQPDLQPGSQQDEEAGDQDDPQILLELDDVRDDRHGLIREDHAHHRDGEEARLVCEDVRGDERGDHHRERDRVLEMVRDRVASEQPNERQRGPGAHAGTDEGRSKEPADRVRGHLRKRTGGVADGRAEDENGERRADRVDDDALPLGDRSDAAARTDLAEQRADDGRPGHDENRTEQARHTEREVENVVRARRGEHPGSGRADREQPTQGFARVAQLANAQAEAALEEDERHRQGDGRVQEIAEQGVGLDDAGDGSGDESDDQQH